jgi:hypothetical protein
MIACGLLLGSSAFRKRLVELDADMPGRASDEWEVAYAISADIDASTEFASRKDSSRDPSTLAPSARLMRAFVRNEVCQRLRQVEFLCAEFRKFLPQEAASQRAMRGELEEMLTALQEAWSEI